MGEAELTIAAMTALFNLLVACAAVAGAVIAAVGLNSWKSERRWQRDVDLAEELLVLSFKRRDAVSNLRQSLISYDSVSHDEAGNEVTDRVQAEYLGLVDYYQKRWDKLEEIRADVYSKRLSASAIWGEEVNGLIGEIFSKEQTLYVAIKRHLRAQNPKLPEGVREAVSRKDYSEILWGDAGEEDLYREDYERLFLPLETYLREKLVANR